MSYTSNEVKWRYKQKAYHSINIRLRLEGDADIIEFIESNKDQAGGVTQLFREALELYIKENSEE